MIISVGYNATPAGRSPKPSTVTSVRPTSHRPPSSQNRPRLPLRPSRSSATALAGAGSKLNLAPLELPIDRATLNILRQEAIRIP
jgi:hypothetical protein